MQLYKCYIPRKDIPRVRDLRASVLNKLNFKVWDKNPNVTPAQIERQLAEEIRKRSAQSEGTKSILEILKELNFELIKEGY